MSSLRSRFRMLAWILAACLGTFATFQALGPFGPNPVPFALRGDWISAGQSEDSVTHFRKVIVLPSSVRSAWIAVTAHEGFEVLVNGKVVARSQLFRPTRAFQTGLSERGQRVVSPEPLLHLSFPREYQWAGDGGGGRLPVFMDIAPYLSVGKNVLAIEVETRAPPALLLLEGEILLWSGERLSVRSDSSFRATVDPPSGGRAFAEVDYSDLDWSPATPEAPPPGRLLRILDPEIYRAPFAGRWLHSPQAASGAVWFETDWHMARPPDGAWIRVLANRPFQLFVNDQRIQVADSRPQELDAGEWIIGPRPSVDPPAAAESLDPEEVGSLFIGPRFQPAEAHLSPGSPRPAFGFQSEWLLRGTELDEPALTDFLTGAPTATSGGSANGFAMEQVAPKELSITGERGVFYAYSIEQALHSGDNRIAIRLSAPDGPHQPIWPPKLSVDGKASLGAGEDPIVLDPVAGWMASPQTAQGEQFPAVPAIAAGPAAAPGIALPPLRFRAIAEPPVASVVASLLLSLALTLVALFGMNRLPRVLQRLRQRLDPHSLLTGYDDGLWVIVASAVFLLGVVLVHFSWGERDETLWLLSPQAWRVVLVFNLLIAVATAAFSCFGGHRSFPWSGLAARLPKDRALWLSLGAIVVLAGVLRAHAMDRQPLDDDELASAQAVLAIARSGVARYSDDVYYTRGPLYHYVAAASVRLFGANVWALRLPGVAFGVATTLLIYFAGCQLLRSKWTGLLAAFLYAIHPYAIFVSHLVRFYQQQQFFTLLTVYLFCRDFLDERPHPIRHRAVFAFLLSCLSQELSVVLLPPLFVVYLLFVPADRRQGARSLAVSLGCVLVLLAVDIAVFQTQCLTKLEGISPNVEASMRLHFMSPMNLTSMFIGYSRLHLALSLLLFAGLPLLLRDRNPSVLGLTAVLFLGVLSTNLLVTGESLRYQYWLLPFWLLLGVYGIRALASALSGEAARFRNRRWVAPFSGAAAFLAVLLSFSPWRIPGSYRATLLGDSASAFSYVRSHLRPGDKVAATEPHAHAGLLEIGRIDYDLAVPLLHDYVYRKNGRLIDRNGSAEVISSAEELKQVMTRHDRLWILVNREKFRSRGQQIRWEYPAARVELLLRENFEVKWESYLWTVFLWDANAGKFHSLQSASFASFSQ